MTNRDIFNTLHGSSQWLWTMAKLKSIYGDRLEGKGIIHHLSAYIFEFAVHFGIWYFSYLFKCGLFFPFKILVTCKNKNVNDLDE